MVILPIRAPCGRVELRGDLAVTMALESDPTVKRSLGGPLERATVTRVHRQRLERMARSDLFFTIAVDDLPDPVGVAGISRQREGATIFEAGVMLLPELPARGVRVEALRMLTDMARTEKRLRELRGLPRSRTTRGTRSAAGWASSWSGSATWTTRQALAVQPLDLPPRRTTAAAPLSRCAAPAERRFRYPPASSVSRAVCRSGRQCWRRSPGRGTRSGREVLRDTA